MYYTISRFSARKFVMYGITALILPQIHVRVFPFGSSFKKGSLPAGTDIPSIHMKAARAKQAHKSYHKQV